MSTTVAVSLSSDELSELDDLRRYGSTREDVLREALQWYARWGEALPLEDPVSEEIGR